MNEPNNIQSATTGERTLPGSLLALLANERPVFLKFLQARVGNDAEDLLQQSLLKAAEKVGTLRDPELVRAWFYRILRRAIADYRARWAMGQKRFDLLKADVEEGTPEEIATCACTLGLLDKLKPEYKEVLARADIDEEPIESFAQSLGISTSNATVRLHRARKALREHLQAYCGVDSATACLACGCD